MFNNKLVNKRSCTFGVMHIFDTKLKYMNFDHPMLTLYNIR